MNLTQLFTDEDAVSPVIGVILMVAITVILAAVIGTFVLGLGDQVQNNAPSANFQFNFDDNGNGYGDIDDTIGITHNGGDTIDGTTLTTQVDGSSVADTANLGFSGSGWPSSTSTGDSVTITESTASAIDAGDSVRIIWNNPNGQSSQTIAQSTVPQN